MCSEAGYLLNLYNYHVWIVQDTNFEYEKKKPYLQWQNASRNGLLYSARAHVYSARAHVYLFNRYLI
jgi:hypothetical protein